MGLVGGFYSGLVELSSFTEVHSNCCQGSLGLETCQCTSLENPRNFDVLSHSDVSDESLTVDWWVALKTFLSSLQ